MKKMIVLLLCLALVLTVAGCAKKETAENTAGEKTAAVSKKAAESEVVISEDTCPTVTIDGTAYYDTGVVVLSEPEEDDIIKVKVKVGDGKGKVTAYAVIDEGKTIVCLIDDVWCKYAAQ